jgi:hypothetical protein
MPEREYTEPTNEQLAKFLVVYAKNIPALDNLELSAPQLELLMTNNPQFREAGLRHHRNFQDHIFEFTEKMEKGELTCEHVLNSGKQCVNYNEPGSMYCGLHKERYEDDRTELAE